MVPLWMIKPFIGLIRQNQEDPLLDRSSDEDLLSDVMNGWLKTSCGNQKEGPTLGCARGEDMLLNHNALKGSEGPKMN